MECPICYNIISNSCIGSCTHHFCLPCLVEWCEHNGTECPVCKTFIREIRPDIEFSTINCPGSSNISTYNFGHKITVDFSNGGKAGITLKNNYDFYSLGKRRPGVIITKISHKDICYKYGLQKGDVILFVNNIPCIDHKQTIDIIDRCVTAGIKLNCILLKIKSIDNNNNINIIYNE